MSTKVRVGVIVGTRPEVIKMAPVIDALEQSAAIEPLVVCSGQQRELAAQALASFDITPHIDLDVMQPGQSLASLTAKIIDRLDGILPDLNLDAALVHGDTTTAMTSALACFYQRIPIGHVEAGLRTYDFDHPWPEEMNRRLIDPICRWCFAPTELSRQNLLREGIPGDAIQVTGNTVIDALLQLRSRQAETDEAFDSPYREILVTGHRRESFGDGFRNICHAIRTLAEERHDVRIVYPVHLNPNVRGPVHELLGQHDRIDLCEPVGYEEFVKLMDRSHFLLTDSGGVQEEAPSLGKPVLVMRETTERPEGVDAGTCTLVGTCPDRILDSCRELLDNEVEYNRRAALANPYGDGNASMRIVNQLEMDLC
ncbi:MAG: UDP-N-acetylglucosamine 2-epimerase (non-hydrolyzing) [Planctomycetes bacterium]|jgi:UDP-N-acetylglucosamine 2-epimerase (non-hydrolysing)|nr:UDP-N-acetylglucosamine 2-epimerase (non-hydrolyzing) [Planctomycetota bacterium]MCP4838365.1 UDP-N-acetylglucosamine 2-epimerase (non-hydrolyzing) [Planctomycetota bacterium]